MATIDQLHRFLFEDKHVRGEIVTLDKTFKDIVENHQYPEPVKNLLGELLAATCLLTATIKFEGEISVQLQGNGPVSYIAINGNEQQEMRGVAKIVGEVTSEGLQSLIGKGAMVITITPKKGQRYQGVVALDKPTLAQCLEGYFETSEQIATSICLFVDTNSTQSAGTLIQLLPDSGSKEEQLEDFNHINTLSNTLKADEIFNLSVNDVLHRLFHEEDVRLFEPQEVRFVCGCSEEKCLNAISSLSKEDIDTHFETHNEISMTCEFCLKRYSFSQQSLLG